jgi:hypothetical protein
MDQLIIEAIFVGGIEVAFIIFMIFRIIEERNKI